MKNARERDMRMRDIRERKERERERERERDDMNEELMSCRGTKLVRD